MSPRAVAAELRIDERTVRRWCKIAKTFPEAMTEQTLTLALYGDC